MSHSVAIEEGNPNFKYGAFEEFCFPGDVSAALIESQGVYFFHLAAVLTILLGVVRQSDIVYCYR